MSENAPPPYGGAGLEQTETDEGRCRTALRQIAHWIDDAEEVPTASHLTQRKIMRAIKRRADEALGAPRSNGAVIDRLEEELGKLRAQIIDQRLAGRPKAPAPIAGPMESLVSSTVGAAAAKVDGWLRGKIPL